jgi:hypothetical protein
LNHDGFADVIVGIGPGGGPRVKVFNGERLRFNQQNVFYDFFAFETTFTGGVRVALADVNADGYADKILGSGPSGAPRVRIFSAQGSPFYDNYVFDPSWRGGVYVAAADVNGDGYADPIFGVGPENGGYVRATSGAYASGNIVSDLQWFRPYESSFTGGVWVAGANMTLPACSDGADNDGDGATDYPNDFSCSNRQDYDETNPRAQCQDGADNDGDGLADMADPGCSSTQDNYEGDKTSQCQDGVDNDNDGAIDYPADFSCSSKLDNDERNPLAQCQDGVDNDGDGATDYPNDFSCSSRQDNDETNTRAQCQDGTDNDGDGLVDQTDPGCTGTQDNNESDGTSQCQDGIDNDNDGATDYPADFS